MKVILTGASGLVGEGVLLQCISYLGLENTLTINRRPLPVRLSPEADEGGLNDE